MFFCYIDESGGFEAPNQGQAATPLMVIAGLIVPSAAIGPLTGDLLALKRQFYPNKAGKHLDYLLYEIKGSDLRNRIRSSDRSKRMHAQTVLDGVVSIAARHHCRLVGRIWVKKPGQGLDPASTYTFAVQDIARHFNHYLETRNSHGLVLCDSRNHRQDIRVAHSVFTLKHKVSGDEMPRILESPVFGRSDNHAGLQLADIIASGLLFPMAARAYCATQPTGHHTHPRLDLLRQRYAPPLKQIRYTYQDGTGKILGGVTVSDPHGKRPSSLLFKQPTT
ncbi:MAG: DUF3800 domain-containing protein [Acidimicrobiia bacterium]|nr:DUF3800 domain-containing protein [Acidimicrobiia bacterium]